MNSTVAYMNFLQIQNALQVASILQLTEFLWPASCPDVKDGSVYDFIIVGGGTAGCVIASRLAEVNAKVLLIEAGGNPPLESVYPAYMDYNRRNDVDWAIPSTAEDTFINHIDGVCTLVQGKMLGGSSSLNYLYYMRGAPSDFNNWASLTDDPSWTYQNLKPLFELSEKLIDEKLLESPALREYYGTKGKLKLRKFEYGDVVNDYFSAYEEIGIKQLLDVNNKNPLGVSSILQTSGELYRESTAQSFLRPVMNRDNLHIMTNSLVTKIIFDGRKNAIGVEVIDKYKNLITVIAKKEVIVTAGALKTPQLLMISGIGPKEHLTSKGINVIADLPVGDNLQDHQIVYTNYKMGEANPSTLPINPHLFELPTLGAYSGNKIHEDISYIYDDIEYLLVLCRVVLEFNNDLCDKIAQAAEEKQVFAVFHCLANPKSRGTVRLNDTNIEHHPIVNLRYYTNEEDLETHSSNIMNFMKILETTFFKSVGAKFLDPELPECAGMSKRGKAFWKCYCKEMVSTGYNYGGTCAMGTVVNSKLLVNGVKRLRIADASIMPDIVSYQINGAVIMIGQKASELIIEKHSLE